MASNQLNDAEWSIRWSSARGKEAKDRVLGMIRESSIDKPTSPFGQSSDGLEDLRGLDLSTVSRLQNSDVCDADFSFSNFRGIELQNCGFRNILFFGTNLSEVFDENSVFRECTFDECTFRDANLGLGRCQYIGCHFRQCNLAGLRMGQNEYDKCVFQDCDLRGCDFGASSFHDVQFTGRIEGAWIRGRDPFLEFTSGIGAQLRQNSMSNVSFANATLWSVTFSDHCVLRDVDLPSDGSHLFFDRWNDRIQCALSRLDERSSDARTAKKFVLSFLPHAQSQNEYILNRDYVYLTIGKEWGQRVIEALIRC